MLMLVTSGSEYSRAQEEYEQWRKREEATFRKYVEERDKEFVEFLKHEWKEMHLLNGLPPDEIPKPPDIPVYRPKEGPPPPDNETANTIVHPPPAPDTTGQAEPTSIEKPRIDSRTNRSHAKVSFYGLALDVGYDDALKVSLEQPLGNESISRFWQQLSQANYTDFLRQASFYKHTMNLNDWGMLELLHALGKEINHEENDAVLFTWFMASKAGYQTKVGYSGRQVCLLTATRNTLYAVPFLTFSETKQRYYVTSLDPAWKLEDENIYTYEGTYPEASTPVEFSIGSPPALQHLSRTKTLSFSYSGRRYDIPVRLSMDAVRFLEYYPQVNFEVYFNATPSTEAVASLLSTWRPLVRGKSEREAVNMLLRFVQTAFGYKTDPDQFGREKPLFPDETLWYPYSDCEDRSILFAFLVRNLTGLDVIGLDYPGHVATAVRFSDDVPGDAVIYRGKKYLICDPTYENADAGCSMPRLKNSDPGIIVSDQGKGG